MIINHIDPQVVRDGEHLIMPGLASVHSHAFQRALRGMTQRSSGQLSGRTGSFWSWRGLMYRLVEQLTPEKLYAIARFAYLELALSGVTLVGEFHYVHHQADGTPYAHRTELADAVIQAAKDVGIRICLIRAAYMRGGYQHDLEPAQHRFRDDDVALIIRDVETLQARYAADPLVSVAVAAHSVRAVSIDDVVRLAQWADLQKLPFHMHVCEQRRELVECTAEYGKTPIDLLNAHGVLSDRFVGVHATHLQAAEIAQLGQNRCFVNICRTTERDLGDGLPPSRQLVQAGAKLCVGTDSHCCGDAFEELRAIELDARTQHEARHVVGDGRFLLDTGTRLGYAACGIEAQWHEDTVRLDSNDVSVVGLPDTHLTDGVVFGATPRSVQTVTIAGRPIIVNGRHRDQADIIRAFTNVA